jgi:hypothetical protein
VRARFKRDKQCGLPCQFSRGAHRYNLGVRTSRRLRTPLSYHDTVSYEHSAHRWVRTGAPFDRPCEFESSGHVIRRHRAVDSSRKRR